jgi:hypothetical protein
MAQAVNAAASHQSRTAQRRLRSFFGQSSVGHDGADEEVKDEEERPAKWSMGVLNDRITHEVPGMYSKLAKLLFFSLLKSPQYQC